MHRSSFKFSEYSNVKLYQIRIILRVKSSKIGNFQEDSGTFGKPPRAYGGSGYQSSLECLHSAGKKRCYEGCKRKGGRPKVR